MPSHDCLSDVYAAINPQKFMEIFIEWTKDIVRMKSGNVINIDGKAMREAQDKINGESKISSFPLSLFVLDFLSQLQPT